MSGLRAALAGALSLALAGAVGAEGALFTFERPPWYGRAAVDDERGRFTGCAIRRAGDGLELSVDDEYALRIQLPNGVAAPAAGADLELSVDGVSFGTFAAEDETGDATLRIGRRRDVYEALVEGESLEVRSARAGLLTQALLGGLAAALPALRECVDLGVSFRRSPYNPFVPGHVPVYPGTRSTRRADPMDSRGKLATLLRAAGLADFQFARPEALEAPTVSFAWTGPGFIGLAWVGSRDGRNPAELRDQLITSFATDCGERIQIRSEPVRSTSEYLLLEETFACEIEGRLTVGVATLVADPIDTLMLVHIGADAAALDLARVNQRLAAIVASLLQP